MAVDKSTSTVAPPEIQGTLAVDDRSNWILALGRSSRHRALFARKAYDTLVITPTESLAETKSSYSSSDVAARTPNNPPVPRTLPATTSKERIREQLRQQWECIVLAMHPAVVECEMHDLTNDLPVEIAEIYLEEFSPGDIPLLTPGAVFYWSIGYRTKANGQIVGYSEMRVRRMPQLTRSQIKNIKKRAAEIYDALNTPQ